MTHREQLGLIAGALMERETIEKDELVRLLDGLEKRPQRDTGLRGAAGIAVARRSVPVPRKDDRGSLS